MPKSWTKKNLVLFSFLMLLAAIAVFSILTAILVLEKSPLIYETSTVAVEHAGMVKTFAERVINDITSQKQMNTFFAEEKELNSLAAFANRAVHEFSGRVSIEKFGMLTIMVLEIPDNPFGRYINIRIYIDPSETGLHISKLTIGRIQIPSTFANLFLKTGLNIILGNGQGTDILKAVKKISFEEKRLLVHFTPLPNITFRHNMFKERIKKIRDIVNPVCDAALVKIYYKKLIEIAQNFPSGRKISLSEYMTPVFELAYQRSKSGNHAQENTAAILALSVYAGHWRFEQFTGNIRTKDMSPNHLVTKNIVLAERQDLRLHFIISAGIKIIADSSVSFAAGEFKELLDTLSGGSGFSFADLAADRAGTYFAQMAILNDREAEKIQRGIINHPGEASFFPDISWLPENISEAQFKVDFENVESSQYKSLIKMIDQQIMNLPLYTL